MSTAAILRKEEYLFAEQMGSYVEELKRQQKENKDLILEKLERNIMWLAVLCIIGTIASAVMYYRFSYYGDLWVNVIGWLSILVLLAVGKSTLNHRTVFTEYFNQASYPIYILHQSVLVAFAYYVVQASDALLVQIFGICMGSFLLTTLSYHLIKSIYAKYHKVFKRLCR